MANTRRWHVWSGVLGGLVAALVVSALPAVAETVGDLLGTQAVLDPGDPVQAGRVNQIDKTTWLRGNWPNGMLRLVNDGSGPALELNTQPGVAPLAVDSKKLVRGLNVDRVDNRHANQMVRAAGASTRLVDNSLWDPIQPNDGRSILTADIAAPAAGILVMGASVTLNNGGEFDSIECSLKVDGSPFSLAGTLRAVDVHQASPTHTLDAEEECSTDGVVMVEAGLHTVDFHIDDRDSAFFGGGSLWVLWVGFDGQGLRPTESSIITLDAPTGDGPAKHIQDR